MKLRLSLPVATVALTFSAPPSMASPKFNRWKMLRSPELEQQDRLIHQVEGAIAEYQASRVLQADPTLAQARLIIAFKLLKDASAENSPNAHLRLLYADVLSHLEEHSEAVRVLEGALKMSLEPPRRADALSELAIAYARCNQRTNEIRAYTEALSLIPPGKERSTMLANRAEAYMATGNVGEAVAGYREALASLLPSEMFSSGVTTLWGLAVALDRSGDLEGAFDAINLARSYDPLDRMLSSPSWFFAPEYDEAYYQALGHWAAARRIEAPVLKLEVYERASQAWAEYLERAPENDVFRRVAEARLKRCDQERTRLKKPSKAR